MKDSNDRPAAPDYTQACVVMFGVNLTWILMVIWVAWGVLAVAITGWIVGKIIDRIGMARG